MQWVVPLHLMKANQWREKMINPMFFYYLWLCQCNRMIYPMVRGF